jgi:hypothetical protein
MHSSSYRWIFPLLLLIPASCRTTAALPAIPERADDQAASHRQDRLVDPADRASLSAAGIDPERIMCNGHVLWDTELKGYAEKIVEGVAQQWSISPTREQRKQADHFALGYLVRSYFEYTRLHNLGVMRLKGYSYQDEQGREQPLLVFRSSLIIDNRDGDSASPCFKSLMQTGHVRHVINLYSGDFPFQDMLAAEKKLALRAGASYFDAGDAAESRWRQLVEAKEDYQQNKRQAMQSLAAIIRAQILKPQNHSPVGNIYLHCAGGMHRSGMVFGVLRRCVNQDTMEVIEKEYARHVAWASVSQPGGFEPLNLQFIRDFDCSLLR